MKASGPSQEAPDAGRPAQESSLLPVQHNRAVTLRSTGRRGRGTAAESADVCFEPNWLPAQADRAAEPSTDMLRFEGTGLAGSTFVSVPDSADELWTPAMPKVCIAKPLTRCFEQPAVPL
jgi:hypothetical protein